MYAIFADESIINRCMYISLTLWTLPMWGDPLTLLQKHRSDPWAALTLWNHSTPPPPNVRRRDVAGGREFNRSVLVPHLSTVFLSPESPRKLKPPVSQESVIPEHPMQELTQLASKQGSNVSVQLRRIAIVHEEVVEMDDLKFGPCREACRGLQR